MAAQNTEAVEAMDEDGVGLTVLPSAFERSNLTKFGVEQEVGVPPLGIDPWDLYVFEMCTNAGVQIELVQKGDLHEDEPLFSAVQIVDDDECKQAYSFATLEQICFSDEDEFRGLQVKLNAACQWKVTVTDIPAAKTAGAQSSRKRAASQRKATNVIYNQHIYEIVLHCSEPEEAPGLYATCAVAEQITINLYFQTAEDEFNVDSPLFSKEGYPQVIQRRVDVGFTNKHLSVMQVCALALCLHSRTSTDRTLVLLLPYARQAIVAL